MKKYGLVIIAVLTISVSSALLQNKIKISNKNKKEVKANNFIQSSSHEKGCPGNSCGGGIPPCGGYPNCGGNPSHPIPSGCGRPYGCGYDNVPRGYPGPFRYGGNCGKGYGCYGKDYDYYGYRGDHLYGPSYGHGDGYGYGCDKGHKYFGSSCDNDGFFADGRTYGDYEGDGFYGDYCGSAPEYRQGYANGYDHINGKKDLSGKYLSLEDAAALLGCERQRKNAESNAYCNSDKNAKADSESKFLNKGDSANKKFSGENNCCDASSNSGKDFKKNNCSNSNANACNNHHELSTKKSHQKMNVKNGKNEALCMNSNNLDEHLTDGNLLEEFDKMEHFKKCARGHNEDITGKDCTVKKKHHAHECKDNHSFNCDHNKKNEGGNSNACADAKENFDYHEHDLKNLNSKSNKLDKECDSKNDITKACADASSKENECKRQNSNEVAAEKSDKVLKQAADKDVKGGCVDNTICLKKDAAGVACAEKVSSPVC